ncbi:hypothetical protein FQZ97_1061720 [compost metagenome]
MMPWNEATRPNRPIHTSMCSQVLDSPTTIFMAWGSGSLMLDSCFQSPTPPAMIITRKASATRVRMPVM